MVTRLLFVALVLIALALPALADINVSNASITAVSIALNTPNGLLSQGNVQLSFTLGSDASCDLNINGSLNQSSSFSQGPQQFSLSGAEGSYSWNVNCSGSQDSASSETRVFSIDKTAPIAELAAPALSLAGIDVNASSDSANCTFTVDGQQSSLGHISLGFGQHLLSYHCTDQAGNTNSTSLTTVVLGGAIITPDAAYTGKPALILINATLGANLTVAVTNTWGTTADYSSTAINYTDTARAGTYTIALVAKYADLVFSKNANFTVQNDLAVNISITRALAELAQTINATACGGVAPYSYSWLFSDQNFIFSGTSITKIFPHAGPYNLSLSVTDSAGNSMQRNLSFLALYQIGIKALNSSGTILPSRISLDGNIQNTDEQATFYLMNGSYLLIVASDGYYEFRSTVNLSRHQNLTFTLERVTPDNQAPVISLVSPSTGAILGPSQSFSFIATDRLDFSCRLVLLKGAESQFAPWQGVQNNTQSVIGGQYLEGNYSWQVECKDDAGNDAISQPRLMRIQGNPIVALTAARPASPVAPNTSDFDSALSTIQKYSGELKDISSLLGLGDKIQSSMGMLNSTDPETLRSTTPESLEITEQRVISINSSSLLWPGFNLSSYDATLKLNQRPTGISAKAVKVMMLNGDEKYYTLISMQAEKPKEFLKVIAIIPQASGREFNSTQRFDILAESPLIVDFHNQSAVQVIVSRKIDLTSLNQTGLIFIPLQKNQLTGLLVLSQSTRVKLTGVVVSGAILLAVIIGIILKRKVRRLSASTSNFDSLASQVKALLEKGQVEEASKVYAGIRKNYPELPQQDQDKLYKPLSSLGHLINSKIALQLVEKAEQQAAIGKMQTAKALYDEAEKSFKSLPPEHKKLLNSKKQHLADVLKQAKVI